MAIPSIRSGFNLNENKFFVIEGAKYNGDGTWEITIKIKNGTLKVDTFKIAKGFTPVVGETALFRRHPENGMFIMKDYPIPPSEWQ